MGPGHSGGGRTSLLASSSTSTPQAVGYPEAFYAHTHKTPERSNRQKKIPLTPATEPITPEGRTSANMSVSARAVGRLRPQQLNLFHANNMNGNSPTVSVHDETNENPISSNNNKTGSSNGRGNVGNGYSHIQQQMMRQQLPQSPPAVYAGSQQPKQQESSNRSVASSTASTAYASQATLAATIPSSHVNIITQAYGNSADIYRDILKIPRDMTAERDIRIAYFRRGRQVLAEKPDASVLHGHSNNVSQLAKMKFQAVSMAYEILSNPVWKESYDLYGFYGPDAFQEPEGVSVLMAEDASLAEKPKQEQKAVMPSGERVTAAMLYNLRSTSDSGDCQSSSLTNNSNAGKPLPRSTTDSSSSSSPIASFHTTTPSTRPATESHCINQVNSDNVSYVSQSSTGTGTSNGVLRKAGSFLEKLNRQKARIRNMNTRGSTKATDESANSSPTNEKDSHGYYRPAQSTTTVRWNEEVEELIFRQDPDEISFKAGSSVAPAVEEKPRVESQSSSNQPSGQSHTPPQHRNNGHEEGVADESAYRQHAGAVQMYPGSPGKVTPGASRSSRTNGSKRRVVLDTAELGTHLEKLDKVADSIADIFDELEASFDGLLGGLGTGKPCSTAAAMNAKKPLLLPAPPVMASTVPSVPPLLPPPSSYHQHHQSSSNLKQNRLSYHQTRPQQQQPLLPPSPATEQLLGESQIAGPAPGMVEAQAASWTQGTTSHSSIAQHRFEEESYHTPPMSLGSSHRASEQLGSQESAKLPEPPVMTMAQEEALRVEEQAMALLKEVTTMEPSPPADVLVKTKKIKHYQRTESSASDVAMIAGRQDDSQNQLDRQSPDMGEAMSTCTSDMAAGGENTTVATSVVSLLDPQQQSTNAPLKPAASTEITGAKASRKRLKNVQRRRQQQQRAKERQQLALQQEQENLFDYVDPFNVLDTPLAATRDPEFPWVKDSTNQLNSRAVASYVDAHKKGKKSNKKTQAEDLYFESLYNNFFAMPKNKMPNEMTVRTKPHRSGCSVSTLSHSVTTLQESSKVDFDPWDLANNAWSKIGDKTEEELHSRSKHHSNVMARVDDMLAQRSQASNLDYTIDSSVPDDDGLDTTYDSETAVDTTFDNSTAVDTAFSSALDLPRPKTSGGRGEASGDMAAAISGCDGHPGADFLNRVFDVPLEAPLEYWCGEVKDCASSAKPRGQRTKRIPINKKKPQRTQLPFSLEKEDISSVDSNSSIDSAILDGENGPPTDESVTLLDPPTHDSRIECDDSTLNTLNTNNVEEESDTEETPQSRKPSTRDPGPEGAEPTSKSEDPALERVYQNLVITTHDSSAENRRQVDDAKDPSVTTAPARIAKDPSIDSPRNEDDVSKDPSRDSPVNRGRDSPENIPRDPSLGILSVETASECQLVQITASETSTEHEAIETASVSSPGPGCPERGDEVREGIAAAPQSVSLHSLSPEIDCDPSNQNHLETFSDEMPSPSSLSARRIGSNDASSKHGFDAEIQDEGNESSESSVSSSSVVSSEKAKSSLLAHMLGYLHKASEENPSLACLKANVEHGVENWQASNDACMNAMVISEEDMGGLLDIISEELKRPTPTWNFPSE